MASFVAYYGKKRSRLAARERAFVEVLHSDASETRIAEVGEAIRAAHIRALKEKREKFAPSENNAALYEETERAILRWMSLSKDAIIGGY